MEIVVCLKQTFDTEEKIVLRDGQVVEDGVEWIINPYDEYAVEEAIRLKEKHGGTVTVVSLGPQRAETALRTALAMGADQAVLINDEQLFGDEYTVASVLARAVSRLTYDLILCGNMAVDDGAGQGGPRLAEILGIPQVTTITKIDVNGDKVVLERDVEGDVEVVEATLPLLVTAQQGLNEPRYPSLPGIMKAKKKPLQVLKSEDLELNTDEVCAKTAQKEIFLPEKRKGCRVLEGEIVQQAQELVRLLRQEAKVI